MSGLAAVLGGAAGGFNELAALKSAAKVDAVFAVNDAGSMYPGADLAAFVTLHPEKLPQWLPPLLTLRKYVDIQHNLVVVSHEMAPGVTRVVDYRWQGADSSGSSGLFAVKVALEKFDRVVLCGVPMEPTRAHFFDETSWRDGQMFHQAWQVNADYLRKHVRSMSGWTAELLGTPDRAFLNPAGGTPVF